MNKISASAQKPAAKRSRSVEDASSASQLALIPISSVEDPSSAEQPLSIARCKSAAKRPSHPLLRSKVKACAPPKKARPPATPPPRPPATPPPKKQEVKHVCKASDEPQSRPIPPWRRGGKAGPRPTLQDPDPEVKGATRKNVLNS